MGFYSCTEVEMLLKNAQPTMRRKRGRGGTLHRDEPEEGMPHRHLCERESGSPSSGVPARGTSLRSCIHPEGMSNRGGRAPAGGFFSEWRCALAWTDRSSHRQRKPRSVALSAAIALPSVGVAAPHVRTPSDHLLDAAVVVRS